MTDNTQPPDRQPVGALLDALGCEAQLEEGDLPYGAIILLAVTTTDGNILRTAESDNLDWLTLRGMLVAATDLATAGWPNWEG